MAGHQTSFFGFNDTLRFLRVPGYGHSDELFGDTWMPAGYPAFLETLRFFTDRLPFTIAVQHLLGLASGLLIYLATRRSGAPRWLALLPAAVVMFAADQLYLEHTLLAETLFTFFITAGLYATIRASRADEQAAWAVGAGLLFGLAALTRSVALLLPLIAAGWLAFATRGPRRIRLRAAALAGVPAVVLVAAYLATASLAGGVAGLTDMAGWNLYGRVAQFSDCTRFDPPDGTERFCESTPPERRGGPFFYIWNPASHGRQVVAQRVEPETGEEPGRFARAAVLGQPWDYARAVGKDLVRFADPSVGVDRPESGNTRLDFYTLPNDYERNIARHVDETYHGLSDARPLRSVFDTYQRIFSATGLVIVLLAGATGVGLLFGRGRARLAALLFAACALELYLGSVSTWSYDVRYGVPPLGALAAAAALGGVALAERRAGRAS
jgi:hypothetical protein